MATRASTTLDGENKNGTFRLSGIGPLSSSSHSLFFVTEIELVEVIAKGSLIDKVLPVEGDSINSSATEMELLDVRGS